MQTSAAAWIDMPAHEPGSSLFVRLHALGDAEALGVQPAYFPQLLRRSPHGAEALRTLPQFDFAVPDALISSTVFSRRAVFSS